ncbi:cation:proton antiporter [Shewanella sp. C32]|uniref:Cation:proton antiporter n=1 Tax=Shewanella electrica TaxID=515560 RepID=A0ABT2FKT2_9GAMM|nr:monovalent cation:proton antiporter family protein [Shewanella electrica]MCH1924669.1 cation:proton antiporter [Shewanella electrica]MCS4556883.1 cation:proton antiporter [Shewanella electrica]
MGHQLLTQVLMMLLIAIVAIVLLRRLRVPALLAYLFTGMISGPAGFNWVSQSSIYLIAELGVVLLMFTLGLEFSIGKLWSQRRTVFGLGSLQVVLCALTVAVIGLLFINDLRQTIVLGFAVALSSTAIVLKQLSDTGQLSHRHGELAVGVLLFQDLAVVPLLIIIPLLGSAAPGAFLPALLMALLKGVAAFVLVLGIGKWVLPRLFDEVARARSSELFVLCALVVALLTGVATYWLGLSMALGAFLAGMVLGESQYRRQIEADIRPFRDLLMGVFFISIGMLLDLGSLLGFWWQVLLMTAGLILLKSLLIIMLLRSAGESIATALATAAALAQMGEFSFVLIGVGVNTQLLAPQWANLLVLSGVLSMALTPWMMQLLSQRRPVLRAQDLQDAATPILPPERAKVLLLGFGRVGQLIASFLKAEAIHYVALDTDPARVTQGRVAGEPLFFGDASKSAILQQAGIADVAIIIITFHRHSHIQQLLALCRELAPRSKILVRTSDDRQMTALKHAGADQVIPEVFEGSLMLVSHVLHHSGVPLSKILRLLENERRNHYPNLHGSVAVAADDLGFEQLFALPLAVNAAALGIALSAVPWAALKVQLVSWRRGDVEYDASQDTMLQAGDILLLCGVAEDLALAELWFIHGKS